MPFPPAPKAIARKAIDRKTDALGLRSILEGILLDIMYELPTMQGAGTRRGASAGRGGAYAGVMPFSVSSWMAPGVLPRWARPMPRSTCGALVNWMLS